jgi:RNA polymerase sigma-32 factor
MAINQNDDRALTRKAMRLNWMQNGNWHLPTCIGATGDGDASSAHHRVYAFGLWHHSTQRTDEDLVQEASLGLMKATDKFDPSTQRAVFKPMRVVDQASIRDHHDAKLVDGTHQVTSRKESLFFNLRRVQARLEGLMKRGETLDHATTCINDCHK